MAVLSRSARAASWPSLICPMESSNTREASESRSGSPSNSSSLRAAVGSMPGGRTGQFRIFNKSLKHRTKRGIGELLRAQTFRGQLHVVPELDQEQKELPLGPEVGASMRALPAAVGSGPGPWVRTEAPTSPFSNSASSVSLRTPVRSATFAT